MKFLISTTAVLTLLVRNGVAQNITSDTHFYGLSPSIPPALLPSGTTDSWAAAYSKATAFVAQLTQEEKNNLTYGQSTRNGCVGWIPAIERLGFHGLCLQDAGNGVRLADGVNAWDSGIHVGATWNRNLAYQRALHMGSEFRNKGVNIALGPVVGPIGRIAEGGRNWEGISNDPYLCGALAFETVRGIQENGVVTSVKHFIGNEQETNRNPSTNNQSQHVESVSSNIDDKTLHELYLWPFQDAVHAGSGNIMCSYNRINNSYACQNSKMLNGVLKDELGFQGFVVSDWGALHAGYAAAEAGLDMVMPNAATFWAKNLTASINNGTMAESILDNMATRIIATWYQFSQDSPDFPVPGVGLPKSLPAQHVFVDAKSPSSKQVLLDSAIEGHVLAKNTNGSLGLPLKSPKLVSLFGYDAVAARTNPSTAGPTSRSSQILNSTMTVAGGSGANNPSYISSPLDALSQRAWEDGTQLLWDVTNINSTAAVDAASDVCIVMLNAWATEGSDRPGVHDDYSDALVINIANQCNNTIVVIHNAGVRLVDQFIEHPNVTALIYAHLPGQDSGRALVSLLYGDSNPSGKLPYSVPTNESAYGDLLSPGQPEGIYYLFPQDDFSEGVYIDYRAFDHANITPRYEFGFGLSYTTFSYSSLSITPISGPSTAEYPVGKIVEGGQEDLWDVLFRVTASVTNTGDVDGAEVAQLYVGIPGGPAKQLRGFEKVDVEPGKSVEVSFDLTRRDLSSWDVGAQKWQLQRGQYGVFVGASSRMLLLVGSLSI
ncbi:probable beta-glucosidase M [Phialocephala subalpina]|uniref:beta-glucosidase n=1 Tax=Phialocephala subalpina TaxID=576137 RepID=A0A1L7X9K2_9HELO|nr:probable beta-glucosidase M [Phialocephala subalpina]